MSFHLFLRLNPLKQETLYIPSNFLRFPVNLFHISIYVSCFQPYPINFPSCQTDLSIFDWKKSLQFDQSLTGGAGGIRIEGVEGGGNSSSSGAVFSYSIRSLFDSFLYVSFSSSVNFFHATPNILLKLWRKITFYLFSLGFNPILWISSFSVSSPSVNCKVNMTEPTWCPWGEAPGTLHVISSSLQLQTPWKNSLVASSSLFVCLL